jgi:hypothetical protein
MPLTPHQARVASSGPVGDKASNRVEDSRYALRPLRGEDPITAVETVAVCQRRLLQFGWERRLYLVRRTPILDIGLAPGGDVVWTPQTRSHLRWLRSDPVSDVGERVGRYR